MMPGLKDQNVVLACKIRHLILEPAKHEEAAIHAVNTRIPNVYRIARVTFVTEQFAGIIYKIMIYKDQNAHIM